ncbi:MAG: methylenetetrahydrofolate reductase [Burkholderiales bacterium]
MSTGLEQFPDQSLEGHAARAMTELLASGSLEMSPDRAGDAQEIAAQLPSGARIYVNHPPRHRLAQSLPALKRIRAVGLEPVAHIAARRVGSRAELDSFLGRAASEAGLSTVLLLGGDEPRPVGPYESGAELLREGVFARFGIREVGLPGYPEGHPHIPSGVIDQALSDKLAMVSAQGLAAHLVTQFSFAPARVIAYCANIARTMPAVPLHVGIAGPTEARALLRFAQLCGVSASLRALRTQGMDAIRLFTHTDPREQLVEVARYCRVRHSCNVVGVHLFSFGGAAKTAAWINQQITSLGRTQSSRAESGGATPDRPVGLV